MKAKFKFLIAFFLLLAAFAWASKWTIDSFDDSPDPGEPDNYIAQESSGGLKPVSPGQVSQQSGKLYVRQKFEDPFEDEGATYQIFQGRPTDAAKSLGKISLDGIPYATLLKMKFFYTKNAKGDDDLETVYFDGKDIFVEGEDPVYINLNGKMEELKPVVSREFKISLTSEPSGATVTVNNASKGETPLTFNVSSSKTVTVVVSKEGYYTTVKPITPSEKQTTQEGVLLTAKKPLDNPATAYRSQLTAAMASKNTNTIKTLRADVQKTLNNYNSASKKEMEAVMSKYPANSPKAANESSADYDARQKVWNNAQAKEKDALNKEAQGIFNDIKDLLAEIDAAAGGLDFALKYEYIPSSAISVTNMGIKDFTINAEVSNSRVKFEYSKAKLAYGEVARDEIVEDPEDLHGVIKIWDNPNENGKYASIYDIVFFYDETPLKILSKGSLSLRDATSSSKSTEKDLNSRIAKFPGKAAWDKTDEAATLAALRAGEIPDAQAVAAPKQPVAEEEDEADYDEDEDEDEFEEGVADQEERDYSRYGATANATEIFGNTDEYLFWTGMVFLAGAIGTGVVGFLQNSEYLKANDAVKTTNSKITEVKNRIRDACEDNSEKYSNSPAECVRAAEIYAARPPNDPGQELTEGRTLWILNNHLAVNQKTSDSFNQSRIIWFSAAAASAAISIILFAW